MLSVVSSAVSWKRRAQACWGEFQFRLDHRNHESRPEVKTMLSYFIDINSLTPTKFILEGQTFTRVSEYRNSEAFERVCIVQKKYK